MKFSNCKLVKSSKTGKMWIIFEGKVAIDKVKKTFNRDVRMLSEDDDEFEPVKKLMGL